MQGEGSHSNAILVEVNAPDDNLMVNRKLQKFKMLMAHSRHEPGDILMVNNDKKVSSRQAGSRVPASFHYDQAVDYVRLADHLDNNNNQSGENEKR